MEAFKCGQPIREYILDHSRRTTPLEETLRNLTREVPRSMMMGSEDTLQLIHNLIYATNAKKVLDIGVFTGCSALAEALALPDDGKVVACDVDENPANVGKPIWKEAGVYDKIDLRIAPALETLDQLIANGEAGTFDFAFIDADKENYLNYYEKCLVLLKPRGIIAVDNVFWRGKVLDKDCNNDKATALNIFNKALKNDPRIKISMLYVGDGLTLAIKL
ncbi:catechol O-methyltransferase domain-containing protein 1-like [Centruroides vittatus]|uniref:catechol O-methyltransferase domain-containing protein 1-like n=1 Tax=Centruroides vittatus TaxID=120091 RepID=UPI00350ED090